MLFDHTTFQLTHAWQPLLVGCRAKHWARLDQRLPSDRWVQTDTTSLLYYGSGTNAHLRGDEGIDGEGEADVGVMAEVVVELPQVPPLLRQVHLCRRMRIPS